MAGRCFGPGAQLQGWRSGLMEGQRSQEIRQKFVEDFQRIHDRKKHEPCIPILPGRHHNAEAWFAELENRGIWEKVLGYLTDPSDVNSAYFACETFRRHLEERRTMMMMPKVLDVLRDGKYLP